MSSVSEPFRLSVCSFGRVFDIHPAHDSLTLAELADTLSRFQLKTELYKKEQRELERARRARVHPEGPMVKRLERLAQRHADVADEEQRLDLALADLERDIRREAKQDLRLWAPALFAPGEKREDGNVVHLSALVLDFDKGPAPEALREIYSAWFHVAHSTWSHTPEHPKCRLVLPFSAPVHPSDFHAIWFYADGLAGDVADPTGRALARAWALPAVPTPERERLAWAHPGPLFDPFALGLAKSPEPTAPPAPSHASFVRADPEETYLAPTTSPAAPATAPEPEWDPWDGGAALPRGTSSRNTRRSPAPKPVPVPTPEPVPEPEPAPDLATLSARVDDLEARLAALEKALADSH